MATVILVRHGRSTANVSGMLAGRQSGVHLDDVGEEQAARAGARIAAVPLAGLVTSPLERCRQTAQAIGRAHPGKPRARTDRGLLECDYGEWQGRSIKDLSREKLWKSVQSQPSRVGFPGGETMPEMQARAVAAVRGRDAEMEVEHGPDAVWVAVSHGDPLKAVLADALGMHLDLFQRLHVDPGSVSIVHYADTHPYVLAVNSHEGDLSWLAPRKGRKRKRAPREAVVGGGAGPDAPSAGPMRDGS
jgi:probable phosphomutase (TIGR03848 family)